MQEIGAALATAFALITTLDPDLVEIILRSLQISLAAVGLAGLFGLPLGAATAVLRFPGRGALIVLLNTLMGLPPVVAGLIVYLLLAPSGPLGMLSLLATPSAMIVAQTLLVTPIVAALSRQTIADLLEEEGDQLRSLGANRRQTIAILLWEGRFALSTALIAGFGRASGELGAAMIVGGNIDHVTRIMTTAIALETSQGNLVRAMALGIVLLMVSLTVNGLAFGLSQAAARQNS